MLVSLLLIDDGDIPLPPYIEIPQTPRYIFNINIYYQTQTRRKHFVRIW